MAAWPSWFEQARPPVHWGFGAPGEAPVGAYAAWSRPPLGPYPTGCRATAGGRGNRRYHDPEHVAWRWCLAFVAWRLRVERGASIRDIAATLGVSRTVTGQWLKGVPAMKGPPWQRGPALSVCLAELPPRPPRAAADRLHSVGPS